MAFEWFTNTYIDSKSCPNNWKFSQTLKSKIKILISSKSLEISRRMLRTFFEKTMALVIKVNTQFSETFKIFSASENWRFGQV